MTVIYWAGDSTVQFNNIFTYPQTGLGQVLPLYLSRDVRIDNRAVNGRSTKSFIDEGRLEYIKKNISEGDFLFIQFGHNDEKKEDPSRYTEAYGSYQDNLETMINVAREKKAHPVLITPLERRLFDEGGVLKECSHGEYPKAMTELGNKLNVPVIDLTGKSRIKLTEAGELKTREWYMHLPKGVYDRHPEGLTDNTHLKYEGALIYSKCIAEGLKELGGIYEGLLCNDVW